MFIRRTAIKSKKNGGSYYTYRLVRSVCTEKGVRQQTMLNLGSDFALPKEVWKPLSKRIEEILSGQISLLPLDEEIETTAQRYAALIVQAQENSSPATDIEQGSRLRNLI